jgi:hypothetical protein
MKASYSGFHGKLTKDPGNLANEDNVVDLPYHSGLGDEIGAAQRSTINLQDKERR